MDIDPADNDPVEHEDDAPAGLQMSRSARQGGEQRLVRREMADHVVGEEDLPELLVQAQGGHVAFDKVHSRAHLVGLVPQLLVGAAEHGGRVVDAYARDAGAR